MEKKTSKNELSRRLLDLQRRVGTEHRSLDRIAARIEEKGRREEDGRLLAERYRSIRALRHEVMEEIGKFKNSKGRDEDIDTYVRNLDNLEQKMEKYKNKYKKYESETRLEPREQFLKEFTDAIIKRMEEIKGSGSWQKGWMDVSPQWTDARSVDGYTYTGDNSMKLNFLSCLCYNTNVWGTFNAVTSLKGEDGGKVMVNKGERAWTILKPYEVYMLPKKEREERPDLKAWISVSEYNKLDEEAKKLYRQTVDFQSIKVFNVDQTNLKEVNPSLYRTFENRKETEEHEITYRYQPIDDLVKNQTWICRISEEAQDRAFFRPSTKEIVVPTRGQFERQQEFYSTLLHEMSHSTALETGREIKGSFGSPEYAREELVAELSAAFSGSRLGITTTIERDNSAHYLDGWLEVLQKDPEYLKTVLDDVKQATAVIDERLKPYMPKQEIEVSAEQKTGVAEAAVSVAAECIRRFNEVAEGVSGAKLQEERRVTLSQDLDEGQKEVIRGYTEAMGGEYTENAEFNKPSVSFNGDSVFSPDVCVSIIQGESKESVVRKISERTQKKTEEKRESVENGQKRTVERKKGKSV